MKKLSVAIAMVTFSGLAQAGEYHRMGQLRCSDCHTMHASRQHGFNSDGTGETFPGLAGAPGTPAANDFLLLASSPDATCLACHDGLNVAPDVLGANGGNVAAGTRSAGFLNSAGDANATSGHTLGGTASPPGWTQAFAWGTNVAGTAVPDLECSSCHAVHGSRGYRNAGMGRTGTTNGFGSSAFANAGGTYTFTATSVPDTTVDVSLNVGAVALPGAHINGTVGSAAYTGAYQTANVSFGKGSGNAANTYFNGAQYSVGGATPDRTLAANGMNTYCGMCHGNFHGSETAPNIRNAANTAFIRHPTTGAVAVNGGAATYNVFTPAYAFVGVAGTDPTVRLDAAQGDLVRAVFTDTATMSYEVGCLTCHKAHGNDRPFGLVLPDHTGAVVDYENGDATAVAGTYSVRDLCITCHSMGRSF